MKQDTRAQVAEYALDNFKNGLNCAESVFDALLRTGVLSLPFESIGMLVGFGGGIGLAGYTCGALSAAVMAVGAIHGRKNPWFVPAEDRGRQIAEKYYRRYNNLLHEFREENQGVLCREICAPYAWPSKERRRNCMRLIGHAAALAYDYIIIPQDKAFSMAYQDNMSGLE